MNELTTSVTALTGDYSQDLQRGADIRVTAESLQWILGDWVLSMQEKYEGSQRTLAADMSGVTGVATNTLRQYAQVASAFPPDDRSASLSYTHHLRAAPATEPVRVLQQAEAEGLSVQDTARLAKGLPLGGEEVAQRESSITSKGASMEEAVMESITLATQYLQRAVDTMTKQGFRLTPAVGQDIQSRLMDLAQPFHAIEDVLQDEVGAFLK